MVAAAAAEGGCKMVKPTYWYVVSLLALWAVLGQCDPHTLIPLLSSILLQSRTGSILEAGLVPTCRSRIERQPNGDDDAGGDRSVCMYTL